jgi:hypothetical protein
MQSLPKTGAKTSETSKQKTDMHLNKAEDLLKEVMREEKSGFKLDSDKKTQQPAASQSKDKKPVEDDAYDEDFDEIEEDLPEGHNDDDQDAVARSANVAGSGQGITVS